MYMHTVRTKSYAFGHVYLYACDYVYQQASIYTPTDKFHHEKDAHCLFIHLYGTGSIIPMFLFTWLFPRASRGSCKTLR